MHICRMWKMGIDTEMELTDAWGLSHELADLVSAHGPTRGGGIGSQRGLAARLAVRRLS